MQEESKAQGPSHNPKPAGDSKAASVTISSQHLRFDLCLDTIPAAASDLKRDQHCPLLDPIASVGVIDLQVAPHCPSLM